MSVAGLQSVWSRQKPEGHQVCGPEDCRWADYRELLEWDRLAAAAAEQQQGHTTLWLVRNSSTNWKYGYCEECEDTWAVWPACCFCSELNEEKGILYLVLEAGEVDLANLLRNLKKTKTSLSMFKIKSYWSDMLEAVQGLHSEGLLSSLNTDHQFIKYQLVRYFLYCPLYCTCNMLQGLCTLISSLPTFS